MKSPSSTRVAPSGGVSVCTSTIIRSRATGPPRNTVSGRSFSSVISGSTLASVTSVGRLRITPSAPEASYSRSRITARRKLGSGSRSLATSILPRASRLEAGGAAAALATAVSIAASAASAASRDGAVRCDEARRMA